MDEINESSRYRLAVKCPHNSEIRNMVVRTKPNNWINTTEMVIIPISVHSRFNEGIDGYFKLSALVNTVKSRVRGKIVILLCEGAHINVLSLKFNNYSDALKVCRRDAEALLKRFEHLFVGCDIAFWQDFVSRDENYSGFKNEIMSMVENDIIIQESIRKESEDSYTANFAREYPDKLSYVRKAELDILEMLLGMKIMHEKGCKAHFYPGKMESYARIFAPLVFPEMVFVDVGIKIVKD